MSLIDWVRETQEKHEKHGPGIATKESIQEFMEGGLRRVGWNFNYGTPIWEKEWDVLLILDGCRYDAFEQRYGGERWVQSNESEYSVGSASPEWMDKTFDEEYSEQMRNTAYVTGNPFSSEYTSQENLQVLDEVWQYAWDEEIGTIHPKPLSDRAISTYREESPERMIVHYMQPHYPYVPNPLRDYSSWDNVTSEASGFDLLNRGKISKDELWKLYIENLEYVVDNIRETVLQSIDADTVVLSADHGNLFGEFGLYEHPIYVPIPSLKRVPWATTSATNTGEYEPDSYDFEEQSVEDRLKNLGYK